MAGLDVNDLRAWRKQREGQQGGMQPTTPQAPSTPVPMTSGQSPQPEEPFVTAFPNANAFVEGVADAVTLGYKKPKKARDFFSLEGGAQTAGMIVGEIPFWLIGGGVAKTIISRGLRSGSAVSKAVESAGAFGNTLKLATKYGT